MAEEITRYIKKDVERELWTRAAGRCQFYGCNRLLYKSPITQERVNIAEKAHIYSFSENGPRGWGPLVTNKKELNNLSNLLLLCHDCHKTIDKDKSGIKYSADLLAKWKFQHEQRVQIVTGISHDNQSFTVFYTAKIGEGSTTIDEGQAFEAMFPLRFPAEERALSLSMVEELEDSSKDYWELESKNLHKIYKRKVTPVIEASASNSFSLFAFAPQPLLILLGALFSDRVSVDVYQLHREPQTWKWLDHPDNFRFWIKRPDNKSHSPVLVFSISARIDTSRIHAVLGHDVSIWEVGVDDPNNDILRSDAQLAMFRDSARKVIAEIGDSNVNADSLAVFPAMPISCAVELGRVRMPKADLPWVIYDQNHKTGGFQKSLSIPGDSYE